MEQKQNFDELYKIRHSLAHVLAQAVLEVRPKAKLAFGPPIDNGCYYDFLFDTPLSADDFGDIEKRMRKIIGQKQPFVASKRTAAEAVAHLRSLDQNFKADYCEELAAGGEKEIGFYVNGPFEDMCAGPHLEHTGKIPADAFKIDSLAGAYWRGSEKNPQLTRIYVLAFKNKDELKDYLARRQLAMERDHRKLGKELDLFHMDGAVGQGLPLWTPNGTAIRGALENLAEETEFKYGYQRVATPHLAKESLYYKSGHLPYYKDGMFPSMEIEGEKFALKPMNCPHHHCIFQSRPRSYRDLPYRLAEYGSCYRYEPSGTLSGLLRVRSLSMNDAHIYCTNEQMRDELKATFKMCLDYYSMFRLEGVRVRFSTHDPLNKAKFVGNPELWAFSEAVVKEVIEGMKIPYVLGPGEAAFYGPKIDFQAKTLLGREETISTTQLDFSSPLRFEMKYIGEDGKEHIPYIVHRAPLGTHERFIAFLIEHFGGAFPTWMAPIQAIVVPVNEAVNGYARELEAKIRNLMGRVEIDVSDSSFNKKIRDAVTRKIPNILVIGEREMAEGKITLRRYCVKEQLSLSVDSFLSRFEKLNRERIMDNFADVQVPA